MLPNPMIEQRDSPLILNLFVLLVSFFSCDWILLIDLFLTYSRLQAQWLPYSCSRVQLYALLAA
jgi:hypothetical protein